MNGLIYIATNLINGKCYVGQTLYSLRRRKSTHINYALRKKSKMIFHFAIRKYGSKNFEWEIIEECKTKNSLNEKEKFYIKKLNTSIPNGYNLNNGGNSIGGFGQSEHSKRLSSERMKKNNPVLISRNREIAINNITSKEAKRKCAAYCRSKKARKLRSENMKGDKNPMRKYPEKNWVNDPIKQAEVRNKRHARKF